MTKNIIKKTIKKIRGPERKIPILSPIDNDKILTGKVALVTGGSGGIGFAITKSLLKSGCKVIVTGTREDKIKKLLNTLDEKENLSYIILDISNTDTFKDKVEDATKKFGQIDILVNSAGIHSTNPIQDFFSFTEKEYDDIMNVNLKGTFFFTREISNYMIKNNIRGHILNISSSTSFEPAWSPYRLSKWAMNGFTKGLADRLFQFGIIVNGIAPGPAATELLNIKTGDSITTTSTPAGRYVTPEEIAEYAKILVSSLGDMVIGETICISGGRGNIVVPTYMK